MKEADPASHQLRTEYKAFDMIGDDLLLAELFYLILGISLADVRDLPRGRGPPGRAVPSEGCPDWFQDDAVHEEAGRIVAVAREALRGAEPRA